MLRRQDSLRKKQSLLNHLPWVYTEHPGTEFRQTNCLDFRKYSTRTKGSSKTETYFAVSSILLFCLKEENQVKEYDKVQGVDVVKENNWLWPRIWIARRGGSPSQQSSSPSSSTVESFGVACKVFIRRSICVKLRLKSRRRRYDWNDFNILWGSHSLRMLYLKFCRLETGF